MSDPISNMLTAIRNAQAVRHPTVSLSFSNLKYEIAKILEKQGFILNIEKKGKKTKKIIEINLKYDKKVPVISGIKRVSKPGQRIYIPANKIKAYKNYYKTTIISTPKGLMTNWEARKQNLGGEILFEIW